VNQVITPSSKGIEGSFSAYFFRNFIFSCDGGINSVVGGINSVQGEINSFSKVSVVDFITLIPRTFSINYISSINNKTDTASYNYNSKGKFIRVGFDYNIYEKKGKSSNHYMLLVGLRYGIAEINYDASNISIIDTYWGNYYHKRSLPESNATLQWFEIRAGIKADIFKNFSLGWSVQAMFLTHSSGMTNFKPYSIPAFGDGANSTNFNFTYSIYYRIPF
jgi:hypothetical protein